MSNRMQHPKVKVLNTVHSCAFGKKGDYAFLYENWAFKDTYLLKKWGSLEKRTLRIFPLKKRPYLKFQ
jgi:hypothetical protein